MAGDGGSERHESQDISHGKKIVPDWSFGVGEPILQIQVIRSMDKDEPATIVALARQTVFAILDTGGIVWAKRLEFTPRCIISFGSMMYDKRIISLISSDSGTLMIYDNTNLKWASQLQSKPIRFETIVFTCFLKLKLFPVSNEVSFGTKNPARHVKDCWSR